MCPLFLALLVIAQNPREVEDTSCPPLSDLEFLPSSEAIQSAFKANDHYRERIEGGILLWTYQEETWRNTLLADCDERRRPWQALEMARRENQFEIDRRRDILRHLRYLIGPEAYYHGQLPAPSRQWVGDNLTKEK